MQRGNLYSSESANFSLGQRSVGAFVFSGIASVSTRALQNLIHAEVVYFVTSNLSGAYGDSAQQFTTIHYILTYATPKPLHMTSNITPRAVD